MVLTVRTAERLSLWRSSKRVNTSEKTITGNVLVGVVYMFNQFSYVFHPKVYCWSIALFAQVRYCVKTVMAFSISKNPVLDTIPPWFLRHILAKPAMSTKLL